MMARPRGGDWLEDEIKRLKMCEVDDVVSLLERHEEDELGIRKEKHFCEESQIDFISFPIKDRSVPINDDAFFRLIDNLEKRVKNNQNIIVHCRMGIGRTSLILSALLIRLGFESQEVFGKLSEIRTLEVPDTDEQVDWIMQRANKIQRT